MCRVSAAPSYHHRFVHSIQYHIDCSLFRACAYARCSLYIMKYWTLGIRKGCSSMPISLQTRFKYVFLHMCVIGMKKKCDSFLFIFFQCNSDSSRRYTSGKNGEICIKVCHFYFHRQKPEKAFSRPMFNRHTMCRLNAFKWSFCASNNCL